MDNKPGRETPQFLTGPEIAQMFRVTSETVGRWARSGRLRSIETPSGRRLYPASQFENFVVTDDEPERVAS